jgi:aldose 1-epimerase
VTDLELSAGQAGAVVDPVVGGRLTSLRAHGLELLVQEASTEGDPLRWGLYPMVPFAGRIRGGRFAFRGTTHELLQNAAPHAIHGTCFDRPWDVEHHEAGYVRLGIDLGPGWPFPGRAVQEIALRRDGLDARLEVHADAVPFPATAGWHPWWRRQLDEGGPAELTVAARRWYPRAEDGLPFGRVEQPPHTGTFDDCFTALTWPVTLRWPGALSVDLHATTDHLVVFDQPEHAVCVEPQSGPPDAQNLDEAIVVKPGSPLVVEASLMWRRDEQPARGGPATVIDRRQPSTVGPAARRLASDRRGQRR